MGRLPRVHHCEQCVLLGVCDFISKPVEFGVLVDTILRTGHERGWISRSDEPT